MAISTGFSIHKWSYFTDISRWYFRAITVGDFSGKIVLFGKLIPVEKRNTFLLLEKLEKQ
jgi:hypothetical protein